MSDFSPRTGDSCCFRALSLLPGRLIARFWR
jgi:hypothetical protein